MRALIWLVAVLVLPASAGTAFGDDPDMKEIIKKADQTVRALKAVTYKIRIWGEGDLADRLAQVRATVRAKEAGQGRPPFFSIEGSARLPGSDEAARFHVILGEKQAISLDNEGKVCLIGDLPVGFDLIVDLVSDASPRSVIMHEFLRDDPFGDELKADSYKYEGRKTIGGVACHVIHVTYANGIAEARWYFGVGDSLPRRVDRIVKRDDIDGARVWELIEVDTSPNFDEETFATRVPEGYEVKTYERPLRSDPRLLAAGDLAPAWTLKTPSGRSVSLEGLRGKVVVLSFWASWREPCIQVLPYIQKLHERFADGPVVVFGINTGEQDASVNPAEVLKKNGCTYETLLGGDQLVGDYRVAMIPALYVIGPDGKVLYAVMGYDPVVESALYQLIESMSKPSKEGDQAAP